MSLALWIATIAVVTSIAMAALLAVACAVLDDLMPLDESDEEERP